MTQSIKDTNRRDFLPRRFVFTPIVVFCRPGHREAMAMAYLQSLGYTNVRNLGGGMNGWIAAERPVVK